MALNSLIRRATSADVPAVVALSDALFQEDSGERDPLLNHDWAKTYGQAYFADLLEDPAYVVLVVEAAGELVGYLAGSTSEPGELRPVRLAELESMFVASPWRGQGLGEELANTFLAWAREQGAVAVRVTAYAANQRAVAFYQRLGFTPHTVTLGHHLT